MWSASIPSSSSCILVWCHSETWFLPHFQTIVSSSNDLGKKGQWIKTSSDHLWYWGGLRSLIVKAPDWWQSPVLSFQTFWAVHQFFLSWHLEPLKTFRNIFQLLSYYFLHFLYFHYLVGYSYLFSWFVNSIVLLCISFLKPLHTIGQVPVNASILYKNQEICNKTNLWKFHLISLFLVRVNSKNAFSIYVFILMAGVFVSRDENSLLDLISLIFRKR